ncbi:MAG: ATP-dependent RecD-like DNA helicase [Syntrophothermus sp.]
MTTIEGTLERITFHNKENQYTVARLKLAGEGREITVVGNLAASPGETLRIEGEWTTHPEYGSQFKIAAYTSVNPATLGGIEKYLGSGLIKGIGPATAKRLVAHFGLSTFEVIAREPQRLTEVEGIGQVKARQISSAFAEQKGVQEMMAFLQGHGISPAFAAKIVRTYGSQAIEKVQANPYALAEDIYGIGFKTADKIAQSLGVAADDPYRIAAGLKFFLQQAAEASGDVFLPGEILAGQAAQALGVTREAAGAVLGDLIVKGRLVAGKWPGETGLDQQVVYLPWLYHAEKEVARRLKKLMAGPLPPAKDALPAGGFTERDDQSSDLELSAGQKQALEASRYAGVLVLTGGPGTGKTTVLRRIIDGLERSGARVVLAAPTGRAAKRMAEATGREARTIHRLLEPSFASVPGTNPDLDTHRLRMRFGRNEDNPIEADVLVIDEASMVDLLLMNNLLGAVSPKTRLILVGDADQLPPVGPGNVLRDIIESGTVPTVRLTEVFRQARESMIVVNAHRINQGEFPILNSAGKDFFFIEENDPGRLGRLIVDLVASRLPRHLNCDPVEDIQVLTPVRRAAVGVEALNLALQAALNPPAPSKAEMPYGDTIFRVGDKVMQIRNDYQKLVFNGDIGRVVNVDLEEQQVFVDYPFLDVGRQVTYERHELDELAISYAVSVHKSQGSEYPVVVMPVTGVMPALMNRNLLYTAITRARKMVVLVGSKRALAAYVRNQQAGQRRSGLSYRLAHDSL